MSDNGCGDGGGDEAVLDNPSDIWFGTGKHTVLRNCSLRSSTAEQKWLALAGKEVQLLLLGSKFENVGLKADDVDASRLGIVNSTFSPPLEATTLTVQPPVCGTNVAGERVCDQRAQCMRAPSGGVECACIGVGLRYKPGYPEDGRRCEQLPRLHAVLSTTSLALTVRKLGVHRDPHAAMVQLTTAVEGEMGLNTSFRVNVSRIEGTSRIAHTFNDSIAIDKPSLSVFGMHLDWDAPPAQQRQVDLDGNAYKYRETEEHSFRARFECGAGSICAADGDTISLDILYESASKWVEASLVHIVGTVESVPSCSRTGVTIEPSETSLPHSAPITLSFSAVDCDAMPINVMHVDFDVQWDGRSVAYERERGSEGSEYISTIPNAPTRRDPGPHTIVVALRKALDESAGPVDRCVIFTRTVLLRCASGTVERFGVCEEDTGSKAGQLIAGGVIAAFMMLGLCALGYMMYRHRERAKDVLLSFLSFEGALAFECAHRFRASRIRPCPCPF
jgi:hypothetical protein